MLVLVISLLCLGSLHAYPKGAPPEACITMTPLHDSNVAQTGANPFTITPAKLKYRAGETINVVLTGTTYYEGFVIQPRSSIDSTATVGTMVADAGGLAKLQNCTGKSSLTHSDNPHKTTLTVSWTAPNSDQGDVYFVATVVKSLATFWTKFSHASPLVFDPTVAATTTTAAVTTTPASAGHVTASIAAILSCLLYHFL